MTLFKTHIPVTCPYCNKDVGINSEWLFTRKETERHALFNHLYLDPVCSIKHEAKEMFDKEMRKQKIQEEYEKLKRGVKK